MSPFPHHDTYFGNRRIPEIILSGVYGFWNSCFSLEILSQTNPRDIERISLANGVTPHLIGDESLCILSNEKSVILNGQ